MSGTVGTLRRSLFGIPSAQAVFRRPGFAPTAWQRFQPVAESLMEGYHATRENPDPEAVATRLEQVEPEFSGFAYEGAGMGFAALDAIGPWRDRVGEFVAGSARQHVFPFYVGVGLAYARLRSAPEAHLGHLDPLLGWVTADGYGFHELFFHRSRTVDAQVVPRRLTSYARRMFDQGVGRGLWFSGGADPERTAREIAGFPQGRHADLWGGVALASSYGGGTDRQGLEEVVRIAGRYDGSLARGAAVAAWGRQQAGNPAEHTELACQVYCGRSAEAAAQVVENARSHLPATSAEPMHEVWRQRIAAALTAADSHPTAPHRVTPA